MVSDAFLETVKKLNEGLSGITNLDAGLTALEKAHEANHKILDRIVPKVTLMIQTIDKIEARAKSGSSIEEILSIIEDFRLQIGDVH